LDPLRRNLRLRSRLLQATRNFFLERDFIEIETPIRVATPALESHIDAIPSGSGFLRTSPELHMKRLLAAGHPRIFQIGPCFRHGERGDLHNPEYTMLEWYRADANYSDVLVDTKTLVDTVARAVVGSTSLTYQGRAIELMPVWDYCRVRDLYLEHAGWDPIANFDGDRFDRDMTAKVMPAIAQDRPVIMADYPAAAAALARLKPTQPEVAERWELCIGPLELANAYSELTDAAEQRTRFESCARERHQRGQAVYEIDEEFMRALESGLPCCAGVALGIDRLAMLLADAPRIDDVLAFREELS
jgi:lysyl-tRNA synthetase class 2